jgi:hypothetical protein
MLIDAGAPRPPYLHSRPNKYTLRNHAVRNKGRHVQVRPVNADGSEFSCRERSRKAHPLRAKPAINSDDVEAHRLIIPRNTNDQRLHLLYELS